MRTTIGSFALLALCLLPSSTRLSGQAVILPKNIIFTGVPAYSQEELLAFTGLKPGATSSAAEVQAAAQKLSDTGLFTDVHFQSEPQGLVYALKAMPASNLLPARFPNLVWWTNEELAAALKTRVPLYRGSIPISCNLQDSVSTALTAMLAEKGVHAKIAIMPSGAAPGATPTALSFLI